MTFMDVMPLLFPATFIAFLILERLVPARPLPHVKWWLVKGIVFFMAGSAANAIIPLTHGEPIRFGTPGEDGLGTRGVVRDRTTGGVRVVELTPGSGWTADDLVVHNAHSPDPTTAFAISRLTDAGVLHQAPIGIFRQVTRPTYDDLARDQIARASEQATGSPTERLAGLIGGGDTWTVA